MKIKTKSGAVYTGRIVETSKGPCLAVIKDGWNREVPAVGIFEDRLPYLEATVHTEWNPMTGMVVGFNSTTGGSVTLRFRPERLARGMILANRHGFRSTPIVKIRW